MNAIMEDKAIAYGETIITKTIRHIDCDILATGKDGRCDQYKKYRATLRAMYHRLQHKDSSIEDQTKVSSHVNNRYLVTPEIALKTKKLPSCCEVSKGRSCQTAEIPEYFC